MQIVYMCMYYLPFVPMIIFSIYSGVMFYFFIKKIYHGAYSSSSYSRVAFHRVDELPAFIRTLVVDSVIVLFFFLFLLLQIPLILITPYIVILHVCEFVYVT